MIFLSLLNFFDISNVSVGNNTYGYLNVISFNNTTHLKIGSYVSIAENVSFLLDVEHHTNFLSTYPFKVKLLHDCKFESFSKGDIVIEDDVWIGYGAIILSGVTIGKGSVISSGSVVTKDVEPYSVVGGVPAKEIKKRFSKDIIDYLLTLDFSRLQESDVRKKIDLFYESISTDELDIIKKNFEWFPKKYK